MKTQHSAFIGFVFGLLALLVMGAVVKNRYVGTFVGDGSGITNAPGGGAQVWSNYQGFIFPAGEPAPDTNRLLAGPSMFFRKDGSLFMGSNVVQEVNPRTMTTFFPLWHATLLDSNEPAFFDLDIGIDDNANQGCYTFFDVAGNNLRNNGDLQISAEVVLTNGNDYYFKVDLNPAGGTEIRLQTNSVPIFLVNADGLVTANGFTDESGTPGSLVAYQASGRQAATNSIAGLLAVQFATNAVANWPTAAATRGGCAFVNSNATVYLLTSTPNSTAWAATNKLAP